MESKTGMMLAAVAAVLACRVSAEEIAFTGGSDGTGTDLALRLGGRQDARPHHADGRGPCRG